MCTGLVLALPNAGLGGVTTWAERTRDAVGVDHVRIVAQPDPGERLHDAIEAYAGAANELFEGGMDRVLLAPQLSGACYAAACCAAHELADAHEGRLGVIGWMHTIIRYDIELMRRFAEGLGSVVCVSEAASAALEGVIEEGRRFVARTGVHPLGATQVRPRADGPLRLIYTGRLERYQKRVLALPTCVAALRSRGIGCELTIIGDGPARGAIELAVDGAPGVTLLGAMETGAIEPHLAASDLYLLPSRDEGLGLGRVEAALAGAAPVVCEGSGGALEGVAHGASGLVARANPEMDERQVGERMAACIAEALGQGGIDRIAELGVEARSSALRLCDPSVYAERDRGVLEGYTNTEEHRRFWSKVAADPETFAAFTAPPDAADRLARLIDRTQLESLLLYGVGAHTRAIWDAMLALGVRVVGVIDDDPARTGQTFRGVPIIAPDEAHTLGAGDVLISSWIHEDAIWRRRSKLESLGLRVHRLYGGASAAIQDRSAQRV